MARRKQAELGEVELMLARALFRSDKWDPDRDQQAAFDWNELRASYIKRANRLIRTFEKDGLSLSMVEPKSDAPASE